MKAHLDLARFDLLAVVVVITGDSRLVPIAFVLRKNKVRVCDGFSSLRSNAKFVFRAASIGKTSKWAWL